MTRRSSRSARKSTARTAPSATASAWKAKPGGGGETRTGRSPRAPHDATGHTWHHPDDYLFEYTRRGGAALVPAEFRSNKPGFADALSDAEIWAALAFIKSRWPDAVRTRQDRLNRVGG